MAISPYLISPHLYGDTSLSHFPPPIWRQAACASPESFEQLAADYGLVSYYDKQAFLDEMKGATDSQTVLFPVYKSLFRFIALPLVATLFNR